MSRPIWTILGWAAIAMFVAIYAIELLPHHGRPATLAWIDQHLGKSGLIAINILIVTAFLALLPYRRPTKGTWKSKGAFIAFVIALMTEMFGWPLVLFLLAPSVHGDLSFHSGLDSPLAFGGHIDSVAPTDSGLCMVGTLRGAPSA